MSHAQIKRCAFTPEELQGMSPTGRAVIGLKHTEELSRTRLVLHREGESISLRKKGRWHHLQVISAKDLKGLSGNDQRRLAKAGIPVVEEYDI